MGSTLVSPLFVGRRGELAELLSAAEAAAGGAPAVVLVGGEAGVGKSRTVAEVSGRLAQVGWRVLSGQCVEMVAEGLAFAPLVDALRQLAADTSTAELEAMLGPARPELARLLPELEPDPGLLRQAEGVHSSQLLELMLGVFTRVARQRPLLLVVEDLHWADRSTLDLVAFLVRALRGVPVLLMATYRTDEMHRRHPLRPLLTGWERARSARRLELSRTPCTAWA